jgi:hypothetical protein
MAVINRNTLVLTGVSVARDVVTGTMGNGLISASGRPTTSLFTTRHPSQRYPQAEQLPGPRHDHADQGGVNQAADGAGRSRSCDGFLASRSPAAMAGFRMGGSCPTAAWHFGPTMAMAMAPVGKTLPWRPSPLLEQALRISRYPRPGVEARKQAKANQAWLTPAGWALAASRRG